MCRMPLTCLSPRLPPPPPSPPSFWLYPGNLPLREYQYRISRTCLFHNTLVCLPTGLGKTLIAAVLILNYLRWFPEGLVRTQPWPDRRPYRGGACLLCVQAGRW